MDQSYPLAYWVTCIRQEVVTTTFGLVWLGSG